MSAECPQESGRTVSSIYAVGCPFCALVAAIGGGWLARCIGWRPTFMSCGGIGLVAAIIFRLTMREPPRAPTEIPAVSLFATMRTLLSKRSYALVAAAGGTATFASFAIHQYMVSFLMRSDRKSTRLNSSN